MGAYYLMFGVVFKVAEHEDYPLFLMVGLAVWIFFSQSLLGAAPALLDQGSLIRKARFPRETIPAAVVTVQAVTFAGGARGRRGRHVRPARRRLVRGAAPLLLVALFAFVLGLSLLVERPARLLPRRRADPRRRSCCRGSSSRRSSSRPTTSRTTTPRAPRSNGSNPVAPFITSIRDVIWGGVWPSAPTVLYVVAAGALALAGGAALFRRMEAELAVVV